MLIALVEDNDRDLIPPLARSALLPLIGQLREVHEKVSEMDRQIHAWHRSNELSRRLETNPGIGPITASAITATVVDASLFKSDRQLAAWIGLVPRQNSSGGKDRLGRISKQGDPYLRRLLVVGAHAVLRFRRNGNGCSLRLACARTRRKRRTALHDRGRRGGVGSAEEPVMAQRLL